MAACSAAEMIQNSHPIVANRPTGVLDLADGDRFRIAGVDFAKYVCCNRETVLGSGIGFF